MPKKGGVAKSLFQYKWSSLPGYINRKKREDWIDYDCMLSIFSKDSHKASLNYQKHIKKSLKKQTASPFKNLRGNIILGSEDFKREVIKKRHLNKIAPQRDEEILAKKIIELVTQSATWSSLKVKRGKFNQTILSRNAAIYFLKKYTDLSNQQISTYFKPLKKSSVSQMSRRFNLIKEKSEAIKKISTSLEEKIKKLL
jgi:chromosomal replication initiation ATPase DnaA